jgi:hypothetical protein
MLMVGEQVAFTATASYLLPKGNETLRLRLLLRLFVVSHRRV